MDGQASSTALRRRLPRRSAATLLVGILVAVGQFAFSSATSPRVAHAAPSIQTTFPIPWFGDGLPRGMVFGNDGNLWFTEQESPALRRMTPSGTFTTFGISAGDGVCMTTSTHAYLEDFGEGIAAGSDGNLWFTEPCQVNSPVESPTYGMIGRITPTGVVTHFAVPSSFGASAPGPYPFGITAGADGNLWFTERDANKIGRISPAGGISEFSIPTPSSQPTRITSGPDGNLWFAESSADKIGRITTAGVITEFPLSQGAQPHDVVSGPDGDMWFTESGANRIGTLTTSGSGYAEYAIPTSQSAPEGITAGSDGALWFTENQTARVARVSTSGAMTEFALGVTLPFEITSGPDHNIWFDTNHWTSNTEQPSIDRLPLAACGDLVDTVNNNSRIVPGASETVSIKLSNCGAPTLSSLTISTTVTAPPTCAVAPAIPPFGATLTYGQSASQTTTFAAPTCLGAYGLTTKATVGSTLITSTTAYYVVDKGGGSQVKGDFNGDGYQDLATATGGIGGNQVTVFYGGPDGIDINHPQIFLTSDSGLPVQNTAFGVALVAGDFNGDGYSDLAVGTDARYNCSPSGCVPANGVVVLSGSPSGLTTAGSQFIPSPPSLSDPTALAAGDFNHDGFDDLAIGSYYNTNDSGAYLGAVGVLYGSASGLSSSIAVLNENSAGMPGPGAAQSDDMGWSLGVGDFKHNGYADLAIVVRGKAAVIVLYGSSAGLTTAGSQYLQGIGPQIYSVAVGDFTGKGYDDLVVNEGACNQMLEVHYGSRNGLGSVAYHTAQEISQRTKGLSSTGFLYSVAGDIKGNGHADLVLAGNGTTSILWGTTTGLSAAGKENFKPLVGPLIGLGDFNHDGHADLLAAASTPLLSIPLYVTDVYNGSSTGVAQVPAASVPNSVTGSPDALSVPATGPLNVGCP